MTSRPPLSFALTRRAALAGLAVGALGSARAQAPSTGSGQAWPTKPIRLIIPFTPGGSSDILGRAVGQEITKSLGQAVVIDNIAGAGGSIGAERAAKAPADGYTLFMGHIGTQAANPSLYRNLPYRDSDFAPVIMTITQPMILVVPPKSPLESVKDIVATARAAPGKLDYASAGNGSPNQLAAELFKSSARLDIVHVPYKGSAPAELDVMAGRVNMIFDGMLAAVPLVKEGRVKALAVTGAKRSAITPSVPTMVESGVPGCVFQTWNGFFVPAGTPPAVIAKLNTEIARILRSPEIEKRLSGEGAEIAAGSPESFGAFVKAEREKLAKIIKAANLRID